MTKVAHVAQVLEALAPLRLAESWDNVGLLIGDRQRDIERVMTCLTITPASLAEAIRERVNLIVTHHPLPFRPLQRITADTTVGRLLMELIGAGISVYCAHTAFDSCAAGINRRLAEGLQLLDIAPLKPPAKSGDAPADESKSTTANGSADAGSGRYGRLPQPLSLSDCAARLKDFLKCEAIRGVGAPDRAVSRIAIACGSGGDFLAAALRRGCDGLVTGEANFHACLEAEAQGIGLLLAGHFASERFAMEELAAQLAATFPELAIWPSRDERDPLRTIA